MNIDITIDFHNVKLKKIKERTWCWKEIMSRPVHFGCCCSKKYVRHKHMKFFSGSNQPTIYLTTGYHETEKKIVGHFVAIDVRHICLCVVFRW